MSVPVAKLRRLSAPQLKAMVASVEAAPAQVSEGRRAGAVMAVFSESGGEPALLFTKRAASLGEHAGQISFPGGAVEEREDVRAAALRETFEEVSIAADELEILARLSSQPVLSSWLIHPLAAWWPKPRPLTHNPAEVDSVIIHPLADLLRQHRRESWLAPGPEICRYDLSGENLWGATARIVSRFLDHLLSELEKD